MSRNWGGQHEAVLLSWWLTSRDRTGTWAGLGGTLSLVELDALQSLFSRLRGGLDGQVLYDWGWLGQAWASSAHSLPGIRVRAPFLDGLYVEQPPVSPWQTLSWQ